MITGMTGFAGTDVYSFCAVLCVFCLGIYLERLAHAEWPDRDEWKIILLLLVFATIFIWATVTHQ